jgi:adenylate cyclase
LAIWPEQIADIYVNHTYEGWMSAVPATRLDSWKEIAAYLRRGTRTVQRWEREASLPVHRLIHDKLGSVYAYPPELDEWWSSRGATLLPEQPPDVDAGPSVAVLPFADLSQEKDQAYFCEGMAEEVVNALGRIPDLRVASRTASFQFREPAADSREIGQRLHVKSVLEGSVRKSGGRLRIAIQLVDAQSGFQLWSGRYDRAIKDMFTIQDEIAESVVRALQATLTQADNVAPPRRTRDLAAYDFYLRGREYYYRYSPKGIECALQMFIRASQIDPLYAGAYAGLADCWSYMYLYSERSDAVREQADWASQRALELNPESGQAWASRGLSLSLEGRSDEARDAFESALRFGPELFEAHYFYARHCFVEGELDKAASLYEGAARVRPDDYQPPLLVAQLYDELGRPHEAVRSRKRGIELARRHLQFNPDDARALYMSANGMVALGEKELGKRGAEQALALGGEEGMVLYNVGCVYALLGLTEPAFDCLEKAARRGLTQKGWYEHDGNLHLLRNHRRFQELLRSL